VCVCVCLHVQVYRGHVSFFALVYRDVVVVGVGVGVAGGESAESSAAASSSDMPADAAQSASAAAIGHCLSGPVERRRQNRCVRRDVNKTKKMKRKENMSGRALDF
jgi:hypothetical protein